MLAGDVAYSLDPVLFAIEVLDFHPDPWQAEALRFAGKRSLWNCSRQAGKSTTAAITAVHRSIYQPGSLILLVSPSLRQSGELFKKVSAFLAKVKDRPELDEDNKLSLTLSTGSRVVSLPGDEKTIRGFSGVDLIIEDEAARVPDDLYRATRPMLAVSGGALVLMSTPFGRRGHYFSEWTAGQDWKKVEVKADQCPRISPAFLAAERRSLGATWYRQEYFCSFEDTTSAVFPYDLIMGMFDDSIKPLFQEDEPCIT